MCYATFTVCTIINFLWKCSCVHVFYRYMCHSLVLYHTAHTPLCLVFVPTAASQSVHTCAVHTGGVVKKSDSLAVCVLYWCLLVCLVCVRSSKRADTLYNVIVVLSFTILAITQLQYPLFCPVDYNACILRARLACTYTHKLLLVLLLLRIIVFYFLDTV